MESIAGERDSLREEKETLARAAEEARRQAARFPRRRIRCRGRTRRRRFLRRLASGWKRWREQLEIQRERDTLRGKDQEAAEKLEEQRKQISVLTAQREEHQRKSDEAASQMGEVQKQIESLRAENQALAAKAEEHRVKAEALAGEQNTVVAGKSETERLLAEAQLRIESLKKERDDLQKNLEAARSIPSQPIPEKRDDQRKHVMPLPTPPGAAWQRNLPPRFATPREPLPRVGEKRDIFAGKEPGRRRCESAASFRAPCASRASRPRETGCSHFRGNGCGSCGRALEGRRETRRQNHSGSARGCRRAAAGGSQRVQYSAIAAPRPGAGDCRSRSGSLSRSGSRASEQDGEDRGSGECGETAQASRVVRAEDGEFGQQKSSKTEE